MQFSTEPVNSGESEDSQTLFGKLLWIQLGIMCFFSVFQFLLQGSVGVFAEGMKKTFQIDAAGIGLLSSSFFYSYIGMQIPAGIVYDKFGLKKVASTAVSVMILGCFLLAWAPSLEIAMISRVLMGMGCSCGFVGLLFGIKKWFSSRQFPLVVALSECLAMAGVGLANNILSRGVEAFGWRMALVGCGLVAILLLVSILRYLEAETEDVSEQVASGQPSAAALLRKVPSWHVLKIREVWIGGLFSACLFSVLSVFVALWAIPFLMSVYQLDVVSATSLTSSVYIGVALSSPLIGWAAGYMNLSTLMTVGAGGTATMMFALVRAPMVPVYALHIMLFLLGFFCAVYQFSFALVGQKAPRSLQGAAMGTTNMITMSAALILQPLIGMMISSSKNGKVLDGFETYQPQAYQNALSILPWCMVLAFVLSFLLKEQGALSFKSLITHWQRLFGRLAKSVVK